MRHERDNCPDRIANPRRATHAREELSELMRRSDGGVWAQPQSACLVASASYPSRITPEELRCRWACYTDWACYTERKGRSLGDNGGRNPPPKDTSGVEERVSVSWLILQRLDDLKGQIGAVDGRFAAIDGKCAAMDERFAAIERRFEAMDRRFEAMDRRFDGVDRRFEVMERHWLWSISLIAVMALGLLAKLWLPGA